MKKKIGILLIIFLLVFLLLSGCFEKENNIVLSDKQKFLGKWENISQVQGSTFTLTYNFFENNSYEVISSYNNISKSFWGSWNISNNKLVITIEEKTQNGTYNFLNNNLKLEITDDSGFTTVLTKRLIL